MIEPTDFSAREQINCVRCLRCKPLPETDLRNRNTVIFCEKMQTRRIVNLFGCLVANPNYEQTFVGKLYRPQAGDKSRSVTPLELLYLKAHYPRGEYAELVRVIGRNLPAIRRHAQRHGLFRLEVIKDNRATMQAKGAFFNAAQVEYMQSVRAADKWPQQSANTPAAKGLRTKRRNAIVKGIAERGTPFGWRTIVNHQYRNSPGVQMKKKRARVIRRRCIVRTELARIYEEKNSHKPQTYRAIIDCFADSKTGGKPKICLRDLRHEDDFETIVACHIWTDLPNDFVVPRGHVIEFRAWVRCYDRSGNSGLFDYTLSGMRQVRDLGLFEVTHE